MTIYITHCSRKKDASLKGTGKKVGPESLYTATPTKRFMARCREKGVRWAVFSDYYGIWFPEVEHEYYEDKVGDPNRVSEKRFEVLLKDFDKKLSSYEQIFFYHNPRRFHRLYRRLLERTRLRNKITMITHLNEIV